MSYISGDDSATHDEWEKQLIRFNVFTADQIHDMKEAYAAFQRGDDLTEAQTMQVFLYGTVWEIKGPAWSDFVKNVRQMYSDSLETFIGEYVGYPFSSGRRAEAVHSNVPLRDSHDAFSRVKGYLLDRLHFEPGQTVIDVGCGYGTDLITLAKRNPEVRFYGFDASPYNIRAAVRSAAGEAGLKNLTFHLQKVELNSLPFASDSVDAVLLLSDVFYSGTGVAKRGTRAWMEAAISEIFRVVRPNSEIVFFGTEGGHELSSPPKLSQGKTNQRT